MINRRKAGFGMPLRSIFSDEKKVYSLLDRDFFSSFDFFSADHIKRCVRKHIEGAEDNSALIYALICYRTWHKKFIEEGISHIS